MAKANETQENEPRKKPNRVLPIILGTILVIGIIFGIKEYIYYGKHIDTDDAQIDGDISPVVARVGGYVDSIFFEENGHVEKGQVLVKLDDRDYKVKLEQALSAQKGASAGVNVGQSQIIATAASSSSARAQAESAAARLEKANKDYARYANLVKDGSITQQQFDQAVRLYRPAHRGHRGASGQRAESGTAENAARIIHHMGTAVIIDAEEIDLLLDGLEIALLHQRREG